MNSSQHICPESGEQQQEQKHHLLINMDKGGDQESESGLVKREPIRYILPDLKEKLGIGGNILITILHCISLVYDVTTFPFYYWRQGTKPRERIINDKKPKAVPVINNANGITWKSTAIPSATAQALIEAKANTVEKVFNYAVNKYGSKECLGTRKLISEDSIVQPDGKIIKKCELGKYTWRTYNEVEKMARAFANGLTTLGLQAGGKICIFAETREEWFVAANGAFKNNIAVATIYATLGEEGVIHALKETEATVVVTSHDLLPKMKNILKHVPQLRHIVYMEHPLEETETQEYSQNNNVLIHGFQEILSVGETLKVELIPPTPSDIAIIMYTSGSTGVPKGVLLSHGNVTSAMCGLVNAFSPVQPNDVYVAFLPLAHVFELAVETSIFSAGIPVGYSSSLTLTNNSPKIKEGGKGDLAILKPTILTAVPFALDRICKAIKDQVAAGSVLKQVLFSYFYDYKLSWYYSGWDCYLVDKILFKKISMLLGGNLRMVVSGGAPLAKDTHEFIRNCVGCPLLQGYGLTESSACATCQTFEDLSVGRIGPPLTTCDVRLIDWEEGGYTFNDQPCPRGEVVLGGNNIAIGYFKKPEETKESFFEADGKRWFKTGDIGEICPDGVISIIDRKKDLVKLNRGEYLSLSKVELIIKTHPLVDNVCVYANSKESFCIALIVPSEKNLRLLAEKLTALDDQSLEQICGDELVQRESLRQIKLHCVKMGKLEKFEIPLAIKLCPELWTPENNLVTASMKLRRKNIEQFYSRDITELYSSTQIIENVK